MLNRDEILELDRCDKTVHIQNMLFQAERRESSFQIREIEFCYFLLRFLDSFDDFYA